MQTLEYLGASRSDTNRLKLALLGETQSTQTRPVSFQHGFSMIELMVVTSIIGLLASTSVMTFSVANQHAYSSIAETLIRDIQTALQAGRDEKLGHSDTFWASNNGTGSFVGFRPTEFIPGLTASKETSVYVSYDSLCDSAATDSWCPIGTPCCIVEEMVAAHCKGKIGRAKVVWNNGLTIETEVANAGC